MENENNTTAQSPLGSESYQNLKVDLDILWTLLGAFLVFFMQCGFAMLEAGTVRRENTINILLKNLVDSCVAALAWWAFGYSFAFGDAIRNLTGFIGGSNFFMLGEIDLDKHPEFYSHWFFQWAFAATAATIVSGALAERCQLRAYVLYTVIVTSIVYPIVVHWVWSNDGWLSVTNESKIVNSSIGLIDYAGSSVVHVTGGGAALIAAWTIGPRIGRFASNGARFRNEPNNIGFTLLGTLILWFGWYGFNSASGRCVEGCMITASLVAVNTTIAAATGGVTILLLHSCVGGIVHLAPGLNGILSGLVAITAGCSVVEPYAAFLIALVSSCSYYGASRLLIKKEIDDPLDASPVHFISGVVGTIAVGFFATKDNLQRVYVDNFNEDYDFGVFYGGNGTQLRVQILGTFVISCWTCVINAVFFHFLHRFDWLRVRRELEMPGLDVSIHGRRRPREIELQNNNRECHHEAVRSGAQIMM